MDNEQQDIHLLKAKDLYRLIRLGHPQEHGEHFNRWQVIEEIEKRGMGIISALGWPEGLESIYKNRYTADESRLKSLLLVDDTFERKGRVNTLFSVLEHWLPRDQWISDECFPEYLPKNKLTHWIKE